MRKFVTSQSKGNRWHKSLFAGLLALAFSFSAQAQQQVYEQGITVLSTPTVTIIETEVCMNDSVTILFTGRAPFTLDYTPNTLGLPNKFGVTSDYPLVHDSTDINGTNYYTAKVKAGQAGSFTFTLLSFTDSASCNGLTNPAQTHSILVRPLPPITTLVHSTYCDGERYWGYDLGDYPNDYEWTNNGDFIGLQANGVGDIPNFTIIDTTLRTLLAKYAIKATRDYGTIACYAYDTLLISAKPTPSVKPVQNETVCHNQPLKVNFDGDADHYRWSRISGDIIPGLNNNGLDSIDVVAMNNSSGSVLSAVYEVQPEFDYTIGQPSCVGNSITFTITVYPDIYMTSSHDTTLIMSGETFSYTATSNLSTVTYAWSNGSNIATISEMLTNGNADIEYNTYSVIMTAGNCTATDSIVVGVIPATQISVTNQYVCADESTNNSYTAPASFNAVITTAAAISDTAYILTGVTTDTIHGSLENFVFNYGLTNVQTIITLNISGIQTQVTDNFTVTVNALPTLTLNDETYCAGATVPAHIFGTGTATYSWTSALTDIGANETGAGILPDFVATNSGAVAVIDTFYVTATIANPYVICAVTDTFTIGVNPVPIVNQINDTTFCSNTSLDIALSGNITTGVTYNWHRISGDAINGLPYSGTNNLTGTVINNGNTAQMAVYEVTPTATGCTGTAMTFSITVIPTIAMTSSHDTIYIMTDEIFSYTAESNLNSVSYQWENKPAGATISETLTNHNNTIEGHTYRVTMSIGNCTAIDSIVVGVVPDVIITATDQYVYADEVTHTYIGDATFEVVVTTGVISILDTTYILTGATTGTVTGTLTGTVFNSGETNVEVIITVGSRNGARTQFSTNFIVVVIPSSMKLNDEAYCEGAIVPAHILGTDITTYTWTRHGDDIGLTMPGSTGIIPSFTATAAGADTIYVSTPNGHVLDTLIITINALPTTNTVTDKVFCSNENVNIHFNGSIANTVYHYILMHGDVIQGLPISGNDSITGTAINTTIMPLTAAYQIIPEANGCTGDVLYFHITVNPALQINAVEDVTLCSGTTAPAIQFSGNVSGATYTWTKTTGDVIPGLAASGTGNMPAFIATNNSTTAPLTATYVVEMNYTNEGKSCTATDTFDITVYPAFVVNTVSDVILCSNNAVRIIFNDLSVANIAYHYQLISGNAIEGLPLSGNDSLTGTAINSTIIPLTAVYQVTPEANGCTGTPVNFHITINPTLQIDATADVALCSGTTAPAIHFSGNVSGATCTWTKISGDVIPGLATSGTGNMPTFLAANSTTAPLIATYEVVMTYTNEGVSCTAADTFDIKVYPLPSVDVVTDEVLCSNGVVDINFDGSLVDNTVYHYLLMSGDDIQGLPISGDDNLAGTAINTTIIPRTAVYQVIPEANGCTGDALYFHITVNPALQINAIEDVVLCNGTTAPAIHFSGNVSGATYTWTKTTGDVIPGLAASGTGNMPAFLATNSTSSPLTATYEVVMTYTNEGISCTATYTFDITVYPTPSVTTVPSGDISICNGDALNITFNGDADTYSWRKLSGNIIPGLDANGTGNISVTTLSNTGNTPLITLYEVIPAYTFATGICQGVPYTFTITINPTPTLTSHADGDTICSGGLFTYTATSNVPDATFAWSRNAIADINNGIAGSGNTATITEVLTNSSTDAVTVLYQYAIDINGCSVDPTSSQVSVVVLPLGEAAFAATYNVCANETEVILDYTSTFTGLTCRLLFDMEAQDAGFVSITTPTVLPADGIHVALPAGVAAGNYHATIIVDNKSCQTEYNITIHLYPLPKIVSQPQSLAMLCSGESQLEFRVEATGENLSYQWYFEGTAIADATDAIYSVTYDSAMAGTYYVMVMADCDTLTSNAVTATTNTIFVIEKWTDVLYVDNSSEQFTGYQWYKDGNPVVIDGRSQYYAEEPYLQGTYHVRIYLADGTWIESCDYTIDNSRMLFNNLYPNPAKGGTKITVELYSELSVQSNSTYELYDMLGRRLTAQPFTGNSFTLQAPVTSGSYHLRIINNDVGVINKRFIVK